MVINSICLFNEQIIFSFFYQTVENIYNNCAPYAVETKYGYAHVKVDLAAKCKEYY